MTDTYDAADYNDVPPDALGQQEALFDQIRPLFAGRHPSVVGATLADLVALLVAGHHPDLREQILGLHIEAVRALVPVNEAMMGSPWERA